MRNILVLIYITASSIASAQDGAIKGKIIDEGGYAFPALQIVSGESVATSDMDGFFLLKPLSPGVYDIEIKSWMGTDTIKGIQVYADSTIILGEIKHPDCTKYRPFGKICPKCKKGNKVIPVVNGLAGKKMIRKVKRGKVKEGGCMIQANPCKMPMWYFKRDDHYY